MKLISNYARVTGLQIDADGPLLQRAFYPVPHERYITIQSGTANQAAKNYDLWPEVLRLLLPILSANKIAVLHLGTNEDPPLAGCIDLRGKTSYQQLAYLMGRTLLHMGNDSLCAHLAGMFYRPLVAIYGTTSVSAHGPYWYSPTETALIESHRGGGKPTYVAQEPFKTVNLIPPEQIANEVLRLLGVADRFSHQSRYWGQLFQHTILDLIPDTVPAPGFLPNAVINVRMDYRHDEAVLAQVLATGRRINLITARPIEQPDMLAHHRAQILSYNHELGARAEDGSPCPEAHYPSADYVMAIKGLFHQHAFFTKETDAAVLAQLRFRYLDVCLIEQTKDTTQADYLAATLVYLNREDTTQNRLDLSSEASYGDANGGHLAFRTNKALLSQGQAFASLAHLKAKQPMQQLGEVCRVIDEPAFYRDLAHMAIHYQPSPQPTP